MEVTKHFLCLLDEIEKTQDCSQFMTNDLKNYLDSIKKKLSVLDIDNLRIKTGSPIASLTE